MALAPSTTLYPSGTLYPAWSPSTTPLYTRTNKCTNPRFGLGTTTGWSAKTNYPLTATQSTAFDGNYSALVYNNTGTSAAANTLRLVYGAGGDGTNPVKNASAIPVTPGTTYGTTMLVKGYVTAGSLQANIWWFDAAGNYLSLSASTSSLTSSLTDWRSSWVSGAAPANAAYAAFGFVNMSTIANGQGFYVGQAYFGTDPGWAFTGASTTSSDYYYRWTGTPDASESTEARLRRTNWEPNPGFEGTLSGWTTLYCTAAADSTHVYAGTKAVKLTANTAGTGGRYYASRNAALPATGGYMTASIMVYTDVPGQQAHLGLSPSVNNTQYGPTVSLTPGQWTRLTVSTQGLNDTANNSVYAFFQMVNNTASPIAVGDTYWIDQFIIEQSYTDDGYFDGGTAHSASWGYAWSGTANASTSIATPVPQGTASGGFGWGSSSTGASKHKGSATGGFGWALGASGKDVTKGAASSGFSFGSSAATGKQVPNATGLGGFSWGPPPATIFSPADAPATTQALDDAATINLGVRFTVDTPGKLLGVRFYRDVLNVGPHYVALWSDAGALLRQRTAVGETLSGWQEVRFPTPVDVVSGVTYTVSYYAPQGRYPYTSQGLATAHGTGPIKSVADGSNGVFLYGGDGPVYPTSSYNSTNYWVDAIFQPDGAAAATGVAPPDAPTTRSGTASGAFQWGADVTGRENPIGKADSVLAWAGSAAGHRDPLGRGAGALSWSSSASGKKLPEGTGSGGLSWHAAATGKKLPRGGGQGALSWASSSTGKRPAHGTLQASFAWAADATGLRRPEGTAPGALHWSADAAGIRNPDGPPVDITVKAETLANRWHGQVLDIHKATVAVLTRWKAKTLPAKIQRESKEFLHIPVTISGLAAGSTSQTLYQITGPNDRPMDGQWLDAYVLDGQSGLLVDGTTYGIGDYLVWARVSANPETVVLLCGKFTIA